MSVMDADRARTVMDAAQQRADHYREALREAIGDVPLGSERASPDDLASFVELQVVAHPPVPLRYPDGTERVISPYLAALEFAEGGKDLLRAYMRAREKE